MQEPGEEPWIVDDRVFIPTGETDGQHILCHEDHVTCWRTIEALKRRCATYCTTLKVTDLTIGRADGLFSTR